ncbi:MAG: PspA/IM30 family protein [Planctomycetales bacterium]|nr:PspA/IM30 family protein [Planctomycetales bacterium]
MKWLESFTLVMRSSITTLREKVEDPERMLHQLLIDMEEELEAVRRSVAEAMADEILLGKRAKKSREDATQWDERALQALKRGDETGAKSALDQKLLAERSAESLQDEHGKQKIETEKLQRAVRDLEDKIRQARQKRTLLLARLTRADSSRRINAALDQAQSRSAFAQFGRLEARVDRAEALSEATDRLDGRDPDAEELERQFEADERRERVQREFDGLKQRLET